MSKRQREVEEDRDDPKNRAEVETEEQEVEVEEERQPRDERPEEEEDDERLSHEASEEDGQDEPERLSRRRRRNRARRARIEEADQTIAALQGQIASLQGQMQRVTGAQIGLADQELAGQLTKLQADLATIKEAQARAVKEADDDLFRRSQQLEDEVRQRAAGIIDERRRLAFIARQQAEAAAPVAPQADPTAARFARQFMDRNPWFDPNDAGDEDSNIAKAIDTALVNEGYAPNTKRFWTEFERRCEARGLGVDSEDDMRDDDDSDYAPPRRERRDSGLPPRARGNGAGAGRRPGSGFRLTPFMVEALEAEGLADVKVLTPDQKKYRDRLINTWKTNLAAAEQR